METVPLSNAQKRKLKGLAQRLQAGVKLGKNGVTEAFLRALDAELTRHELVKIRFTDHKEEKKVIAPALAEKTSSHLVMRVGNVAVLFRQNPDEASRTIRDL
jgi:RNA-binding protein